MENSSIRLEINKLAHKLGYWSEEKTSENTFHEKLVLIHSELSELLEAHRKENFCKFTENELEEISNQVKDENYILWYEKHVKHTVEEEFADADIRLNDLAFEMGINVPLHVTLKFRYNTLKGKNKTKKY